jgi:acetyl-CoA carboxylase biotin carboxyl carrier protein
VGTFYSAQTPEDPPFVKVGDKVTPTTTVCLIEAMKVFNPIPSEVAGTIAEVLVKNGDAVEYGQALFKVRP